MFATPRIGQVTRIEHERLSLCLDSIDRERDGTAKSAFGETDIEVEVEMTDAHVVWAGMGMDIPLDDTTTRLGFGHGH